MSKYSFGRRSMILPLVLLFLSLAFPALCEAATYVIRPDGGTADQCTGLVDAPYPGAGVNQPCAWSHPFWALDAFGNWKIAGGDTLTIHPGSYRMGLGAPNTAWCDAEGAFDCHLPPLPSGPDATHPTRILGLGWDQGCANPPELWGAERPWQILSLDGTSNAVIGCLEITDRSDCVESHADAAIRCERDTPPFGNWAAAGIYAADSSNVILKDLNIDGLASHGVWAGRLSDWTVEDVRIAGNGWVGWDGDIDGTGGGSACTGDMIFRNWLVEWNGCGEKYPEETPQGCWAQTAGGWGDGVGLHTTGGNWIIEDSLFRYNTSDGLDMLYVRLDPSKIQIKRTQSYGNAGDQIKVNGPTQVENTLMVSNCGFFEGKPFTYHVDNCRAGGSALAFSLRKGNQVSVINSTIGGQGDCLCLVECDSGDCDGSETLIAQNNIFMGYPEFGDPSDRACYIWFEPAVFGTVNTDYNVVFNAKIGNVGLAAHDLEQNPLVVNSNLETFDGHLQAGSPAIHTGLPVGSLGGLVPGHDLENISRPQGRGVDRGAYEVQEPTLLCADDLIYQGAFAYPPGDEWTYNGHALAYYPDGDPNGPADGYPGSLYAAGNAQLDRVGEMSIPSPLITKNFEDLPRASVLQPLGDITEGWKDNCTYTEDCLYREVDGLAYLPHINKIVWNLRDWYNAGGYDQDSLGWSDLDMTGAEGVWHIGERLDTEFHNARTCDYLFTAPEPFADQYLDGKWLIAGNHREAGAFGGSQGPTLYALAPWQDGNPPASGQDLEALPLVYYPEIYDCVWNDPGVCAFPGYRAKDNWGGGVWVQTPTKTAVLIFGRKGLGPNCYGTQTECGGDPCDMYKGYHAYPYEPEVLFYDPADLKAVVAGTQHPWEVLPYAIYRPLGDVFDPECALLGAAAYDEGRGFIYVTEREAGPSGETVVHVWKVGNSDAAPIIIDHTCTDISKIPDFWLERAKALTVHYAHTSHGSQIVSGIENLESLHAQFAVSVRQSPSEGLPPIEDPPALWIYDGNPPETYIEPEDYWDGEGGLNRTRAVADTGHYDFSMWAWCGQVSEASEGYIQSYLNAMAALESEYPDMRFIYMTGHLDGTRSIGNLHERNEQIRRFCRNNNKVLYDFADIERYDPGGKDYLDLGADDNCDYDGGNWADAWCAAHPGSELCDACACDHSKPLNCNLKAGAFWWMMARLAGWDGSEKTTVKIVSGDFNADGVADLAGLNSLGAIYYTTDLSNWTGIPGNLSALAVGDFNGDGHDDLAGVNGSGAVYYTTNLSTWTGMTGNLSVLAVGDFNDDGHDDLAGVNGSGAVYYTTDLTTWTGVPGNLSTLVVGDFNDDGHDDLAGVNGSGAIYYTTNLGTWNQIPGSLETLAVGDFNNDGHDDFSGRNAQGHVYYTTDRTSWNQVPGTLGRLLSADLNGDGADDLSGLNSLGHIYYTTNLSTWHHVSGVLSNMISGNFNATGGDDLAGLNANGDIFYTTNLSTWTQIPGKLAY